MWDLSSPARDQTFAPCVGRLSCNHWTAREVLLLCLRFSIYSIGISFSLAAWSSPALKMVPAELSGVAQNSTGNPGT